MIRCVHARLHPGNDVRTALDLELMDVRRVSERFQLLGNPERLVAVTAGVADEDVGHAQDLVGVRQELDGV